MASGTFVDNRARGRVNRRSFEFPIRVYYEDTDAIGVVYHGQYLNFFERARTEWLRELGYDQSVLSDKDQVLFAVSKLEIRYLKPARLDDLLVSHLALTARRRASIVVAQSLRRADETIADALVTIACINPHEFRPRPLPAYLQQCFDG